MLIVAVSLTGWVRAQSEPDWIDPDVLARAAGEDPVGFEFAEEATTFIAIDGDRSVLSVDSLSDEEVQLYRTQLEQSFLRPGLTTSGSLLAPFASAKVLARGFRMSAETGIGYDSNTLLNNGGYRSPTFPERGHRGGMVSWVRLNAGYSSGSERDGKRIFYGFDIGGDLFAYDSSFAQNGRDLFQPRLTPYFGFRGAKTTVRVSTFYDRSAGNFLYGYDVRREAPVAEADSYGYNLAVSRDFRRGTLMYLYDFRRTDFGSSTLLNDQDSHIHDLSYLYDLPAMPKTNFGLGFRFGDTATMGNPNLKFYEPSFRLNYAATAKTSLNGRIGYAFQDYNGPASLNIDGRMTLAVGANWAATERLRFGFTGYRDFNPSFVTSGESFDTDGFLLTANYASPWWLLHFQTYVGYERADYYSTVSGPVANREDEFFRWGISASRPIRLVRWVDTSISFFYDYTENQSNDFQGAFDRHFTGLRLTGSL